jgi:hypothetical protein
MPNPNRLVCPHCKQPMSVDRLGVRLPPIKAAILDVIRGAGDAGATTPSIVATVYRDRPAPKYTSIKSHVFQINEVLEETDFIIKSDRHYWNSTGWPHWRLEKRKGI